MENFNFFQFLETQWLGISIIQLVQTFGLIFLGFLLRRILLGLLSSMIAKARKTRFSYDHLFLESLARPLGWLPILTSIYFASLVLQLPSEPIDLARFATALYRASWIILATWSGIRLYGVLCDFWAKLASQTETKLDDQLIPILRKSGRVFLFLMGIVFFFQNMGYSVGSLLASFGIGGAALALASKDTLSNLFGSLVIFFDRPFQIGDWIEVDHIEGIVEDVGLRTIRIRTFANSITTVPNSFFTTSVINNWSKMEKRRIKLTIGLTYETSAQQMQNATNAIKTLILENKNLRHDFFLVNFIGFGASSLDIQVYCFTVTTDWETYMDIQEAFLLKIMTTIESLGLEFAFPTRTLHVKTTEGGTHQAIPPFRK